MPKSEQLVISGVQEYEKPPLQPTPMDLLSIAIQKESAIDVIERLAALQEKAMARDAEQQFNEAMNACQSEIPRVVPDLDNPQTKSRYASYQSLDAVVRPIYIKHGFSLSFNTEECPKPETVRSVCYVSHKGGHTRKYQVDMPADGKGAKGGDVMTKTHATGAAMSYGARYLLRYIFNIAVGEDDTDGNLEPGWLEEKVEWIANCRNAEELDRIFKQAFQEAREQQATTKTKVALVEARDKKRKEF